MNIENEIFETIRQTWGEKTLPEIALKLCEEAGEVADELGDVLIAAARLAHELETTLDELLARRWNEIKTRCAAIQADR